MVGRGRGALAARGTRREPVPGGSVAASMPPQSRNRRGHRTIELVGSRVKACLLLGLCWEAGIIQTTHVMHCLHHVHRPYALLALCTPTICIACTLRTDYLDWSLPAHRRGTLRGMDAA
ncbi:hypothetical protein E1J24_10925 [Xanthomonas hortorum pv. pelargonii]|uniref:Uncharacterized protein n=1 Tax=Xanthomonas hortorum pv. pelargonii TaxID=453602 RepID=A0AAW9ZR50_9XANT|nr:hypothetical protein [Xanthomonas hortorum pv. pelargonii]